MINKATLSRLFLIASLACFVVAWLMSIDKIFHHGNEVAWQDGGFIFLVLSMLLPQLNVKT